MNTFTQKITALAMFTVVQLIACKATLGQQQQTVPINGEIEVPINYDPAIKSISIGTSNDILFGTDHDFTTDLELQIVTKPWKVKLPFLIGVDNKTNGYTIGPGHIREARTFQQIGLLLAYYTPAQEYLKEKDPLYTTRPYASIQSIEIGKISERLTHDYQAGRDYYSRLHSKLMVGLTGGPAAQNLQYWFHDRILKNPEINPEGWHNQMGGMSNQLVVNYHLGYAFKWGQSPIIPSQKARYKVNDTLSVHFIKTYQNFNGIGSIKINVGNWRNDIALNYRVNLFNINMATQYFAGYDNGNYALVPGGLPHMKKKIMQDYPEALLQNQYLINYRDLRYPNEKIKEDQGFKFLSKGILSRTPFHVPEIQIAPKTQTNALKVYNRPFAFQTYFDADVKFVAHDATLQGVLFYPRDSNPNYMRLIHPFQAMASFGTLFRFGGTAIDVGTTMRSREYYEHISDSIDPKTQELANVIPIANTFHWWNYIRVTINPNYYYEKSRITGRFKSYLGNKTTKRRVR